MISFAVEKIWKKGRVTHLQFYVSSWRRDCFEWYLAWKLLSMWCCKIFHFKRGGYLYSDIFSRGNVFFQKYCTCEVRFFNPGEVILTNFIVEITLKFWSSCHFDQEFLILSCFSTEKYSFYFQTRFSGCDHHSIIRYKSLYIVDLTDSMIKARSPE